MILSTEALARYVRSFNDADEETVRQHVPNAACLDWLAENVPMFECPDKELEEIYYFRWWTFRKHLKRTPRGFIVTEFLPPVDWAGAYNSISCAAGHHIREGRWLRDSRYLEDTIAFWFSGEGSLRSYSNWVTDSTVRFCETRGDFTLARDLLARMVENFQGWERDHRHESGLYWSDDDRDGGEFSISGPGLRPTLNSYLYGEAQALARVAAESGRTDLADRFAGKAAEIKHLVEERLWDSRDAFFKAIPLDSRESRVPSWDFATMDPSRNVRELHGFTPWYFGLPGPGFERAWGQLADPRGFMAEHGLTTAEQRHPRFSLSYEGHECQWNGPSWPYATSVTLTALATLLAGSTQNPVGEADYLRELLRHARASHRRLPDGRCVPWIDENLNPLTGDWIARTRLSSWENGTWSVKKGGYERGKDYNHATFCDLVIAGLVGLQPSAGDKLSVSPMLPEGTWDSFCLDRVICHGKEVTVVWDRNGDRYDRGAGLAVFVDGEERDRTAGLTRLTVTL